MIINENGEKKIKAHDFLPYVKKKNNNFKTR